MTGQRYLECYLDSIKASIHGMKLTLKLLLRLTKPSKLPQVELNLAPATIILCLICCLHQPV